MPFLHLTCFLLFSPSYRCSFQPAFPYNHKQLPPGYLAASPSQDHRLYHQVRETWLTSQGAPASPSAQHHRGHYYWYVSLLCSGDPHLMHLSLRVVFLFTSSWELSDSILSTPFALLPGVNIPLARAATAKDITAQKALRNSLPPCAEKSQLCSCVLSGGSTKSPAPCSSEQAEI